MIVSFSFYRQRNSPFSFLSECFGPVPSYIPFVVCVYMSSMNCMPSVQRGVLHGNEVVPT